MQDALYFPSDDSLLDVLRKTLEHWRTADSQCSIFAILPEADQNLVAVLQAECVRLNIPLAGAIFPALIKDGRFIQSGMWLLKSAISSKSKLVENLDKDASAAASQIIKAIEPQLDVPHKTLFMVFDGMVPNISSILDEIYVQLGDMVGYVGANAGSENFIAMDCLFDSQQRIGNGVLCLLLPPELKTALAHGYKSPPENVTATSSIGNRIASIDWQPAFTVYQTKIKQLYNIELNQENFYRHAAHFPLGIILANQVLVRIPVGVDEDGTIYCAGEVPDYAVMTLLQASEENSLSTVKSIAGRLGDVSSSNIILSFYCAGRRMHMGSSAELELEALSHATGASLIGALSLGEIGSLQNSTYPLFHNGTLVGVTWS